MGNAHMCHAFTIVYWTRFIFDVFTVHSFSGAWPYVRRMLLLPFSRSRAFRVRCERKFPIFRGRKQIASDKLCVYRCCCVDPPAGRHASTLYVHSIVQQLAGAWERSRFSYAFGAALIHSLSPVHLVLCSPSIWLVKFSAIFGRSAIALCRRAGRPPTVYNYIYRVSLEWRFAPEL